MYNRFDFCQNQFLVLLISSRCTVEFIGKDDLSLLRLAYFFRPRPMRLASIQLRHECRTFEMIAMQTKAQRNVDYRLTSVRRNLHRLDLQVGRILSFRHRRISRERSGERRRGRCNGNSQRRYFDLWLNCAAEEKVSGNRVVPS